MPVLSAADLAFLQTHGFFNLYSIYRDRLLAIAKGLFGFLKATSGLTPDQWDVTLEMETALKGSTVFADIIADLLQKINFPGPNDPYWPQYWAEPVAIFVVHQEWQDIVK